MKKNRKSDDIRGSKKIKANNEKSEKNWCGWRDSNSFLHKTAMCGNSIPLIYLTFFAHKLPSIAII